MTFDKTRILIFSSSYLPVVGGVQTVAHNLARQLSIAGHNVRVVTNRYPLSLPASEVIEGLQVDRTLLLRPQVNQLRRNRSDLFLASFYFGPASYWRLKRIFRQFRPQVVNVHFPDHQVPFVLKLREQFDFRLVVSLHGDEVESLVNANASKNGARGDALRRMRAILQTADTVSAVSHNLLNKALLLEPGILDKSYVIHNGIDPARFEQNSAYHHPRPYIFAMGRLVHKKGFDLLINAFAQWEPPDKPDLIIAGTGEERNALNEQIQRLGLNEKIHLFGAASSEQAIQLLNGCSGVVVPSRTESFGIVALEALAAGKPVVAARTGGLEEFLLPLTQKKNNPLAGPEVNEHPDVTLVEPSVEGIARGLCTSFTAPGNGAGRKYILPEKFTWPAVARNYEHLLLGHRNGN